jgi:hypothetical protein
MGAVVMKIGNGASMIIEAATHPASMGQTCHRDQPLLQMLKLFG